MSRPYAKLPHRKRTKALGFAAWGGSSIVFSCLHSFGASAAIQNAGRVGASKRGEDGGPVHFAQVYTVLLPRRDCAPGPENQSPEGAPKPSTTRKQHGHRHNEVTHHGL